MRRPRCCWPVCRRRWCSRCTRSSASTSRWRRLPGWHTTIFPPYFVAGAIYSGFAMVLTLAIPIRKFYHLEDLVTAAPHRQHGQGHAGDRLIVAYGYGMEVFMAWYSASHWEVLHDVEPHVRAHGLVLLDADRCNIAIPLTTLWSRKLRVNVALPVLAFVHREHGHVV